MGLRANLMHIFGVFNKKEEGSAVTIDRRMKCLSRIYQLLGWSRTVKNLWHPKAARFSLRKMEHSGNHNSQNSEWALLLVTDFGRLVNIKTYKEIEPWVWACVQLKLGNPQITRNHFRELRLIYNEENAINWTPKDRKQNIPTLKQSE